MKCNDVKRVTFVVAHYYTLYYIITLIIITYDWFLHHYYKLLHIITLPIITYFDKFVIMYNYIFITTLLHHYYIIAAFIIIALLHCYYSLLHFLLLLIITGSLLGIITWLLRRYFVIITSLLRVMQRVSLNLYVIIAHYYVNYYTGAYYYPLLNDISVSRTCRSVFNLWSRRIAWGLEK